MSGVVSMTSDLLKILAIKGISNGWAFVFNRAISRDK
jgi:hypothetical protein